MKVEMGVKRQTVGVSVEGEQFVTFTVDGQAFGIPALRVRDVLRRQRLTRMPLARSEIAGTINLRGHIVTAINSFSPTRTILFTCPIRMGTINHRAMRLAHAHGCH